ncbi:MAG TPA: nuclear transport factor 2 family protein [Candidatus Polarisedimenticolia bacterium]|nr:nuclear transport factor 2 family protein [Candidatus Polarisedimenticolia bacterium]
MKRRVAVLACLVVLCTVRAQAVDQEAPWSAIDAAPEIQKLEQLLARAIVDRDAQVVQRIEAKGYVHTDSEGKVSHRDDFLSAYQSGPNPIRSLKFDDLQVDVYGDAAVVRGRLTMEMAEKGAAPRVGRYTRFYVRFPVGWQAVAGHSSLLKSD